jgi:hypothetical protein
VFITGGTSDGGVSSATVTHTDVHPEFPSLRIPSAVIYKFFKVISDKLVDMGPASGKFATLWECTILDSGGRACCNRRRINHDKNKSCQTSNLIAHLRERSATCSTQFLLPISQVEIGSKNCVEVDGDMVKIHNFSESFLHHVDLLWLRVRGLSKSMISSDEFREFVLGYEPRASFPHPSTINHITEAVQALQADERKSRISNLAKEFKGLACVGLQVDMWTGTTTHTAYDCVTMTTTRDPTDAKADEAQL